MDIYIHLDQLDSIKNNSHYLNRYKKFIVSKLNRSTNNIVEKHHILPKAKDMFPQYKNLNKNKWNCIELTPREHFIAHLLLWKAYKNRSMTLSMTLISNEEGFKLSSKEYKLLKEESKKYCIFNKRDDGTSVGLDSAMKRVKEGTHHFLKRPDGTSIQTDNVKNGTHNFLKQPDGSSISKEYSIKRVKEGTHNLLRRSDGTSVASDRSKEGTNPFQKNKETIPCYDKNGEYKRVPKDVYYSQNEKMSEREWVSMNSLEGRKRISLFKPETKLISGSEKTCVCINKDGIKKRISSEEYFSQVGEKHTWEWVHISSKEGKERKPKIIIS